VETETGPGNSRTYAATEIGLRELRHWLTETAPDRRVRSDAAPRTFFPWLLEPDEARARAARGQQAHWRGVLEELVAIRAEPRGPTRKEHAYLLALEGGIRSTETRLEWLEWALEQLSSPAWTGAGAEPETAAAPV
jgi:PadR family transcriptional regulator AphA